MEREIKVRVDVYLLPPPSLFLEGVGGRGGGGGSTTVLHEHAVILTDST